MLVLGARPQQRRERAEGGVGEQHFRRRERGARIGRGARRREAVLLVEREDAARAVQQQARLLAAPEVAGGVDQVR